MEEHFLHFVWRYQRYHQRPLYTTIGESVRILDAGQYNTDAGPDFTNARLYIEDTLWAGNLEIHVRSSDWLRHGHQSDPAYDNIILHVVLEEDVPIIRQNGVRIPCLELKPLLDPGLLKRYTRIQAERHPVACHRLLDTVDNTRWIFWLDRLLIERLQEKTERIREQLLFHTNDWEAVLYEVLASGLGLRVNTAPMLQLARSLPLRTLQKNRNQLPLLEALLFGQAGMLDTNFEDAYPQRLQREYAHLQRKYGLTPMRGQAWKFSRMRPAGFPSVRIAQLARLLHQSNYLLSKVLAVQSLQEVENMFELRLSGYWQDHYRFDRPSASGSRRLGKTAIHLLVINSIAPFLFLYGTINQQEKYKDVAFRLLEAVPAERNAILRRWAELNRQAASAYQSQAIIQLDKQYCRQKRCLECAIGNQILMTG